MVSQSMTTQIPSVKLVLLGNENVFVVVFEIKLNIDSLF